MNEEHIKTLGNMKYAPHWNGPGPYRAFCNDCKQETEHYHWGNNKYACLPCEQEHTLECIEEEAVASEAHKQYIEENIKHSNCECAECDFVYQKAAYKAREAVENIGKMEETKQNQCRKCKEMVNPGKLMIYGDRETCVSCFDEFNQEEMHKAIEMDEK